MVNLTQQAIKDKKLTAAIIRAKLAGNPKTNPAKKPKPKPCTMNTDVCKKYIVDYRRRDYVAYKHFTKFGKQMRKLIKEFKAEYAWAWCPSKISNKYLRCFSI